MKRSGFIFLLLFICFQSAFSQEQINFKIVNDSTYNYFVQKKWNDLITLGKSALKNDIDYYYLRMRIGIAYYEKKNYRQAIIHLEKANQFNSGDESTMVYLYYSYMLAGRTADALIYAQNMPEALKHRLNITKKLINNIYVESGYAISNNISKNKNNDIDGEANIYGEADLIKNTNYTHGGAKFNLSPKLNMYLGYTYLNISKLKQIQQHEMLKDWDDYILKQDGVYGNLNIHLKNGFTLTPAYHYLHINYETIFPDTFTLAPLRMINKNEITISDFVASLALTKDISYFTFGINAAVSKLNLNRQLQLGLTCVYYPFGNLNLYSITSFTNWSQRDERSNTKPQGHSAPPPPITKNIIAQTIGFKVHKSAWIEISATFGDMENFSEKNAFIVYNNSGTIKHKYGATFILPLFQNFEFSLRYSYFENELQNLQFINPSQTVLIKNKYINQSFIGGLKWTF